MCTDYESAFDAYCLSVLGGLNAPTLVADPSIGSLPTVPEPTSATTSATITGPVTTLASQITLTGYPLLPSSPALPLCGPIPSDSILPDPPVAATSSSNTLNPLPPPSSSADPTSVPSFPTTITSDLPVAPSSSLDPSLPGALSSSTLPGVLLPSIPSFPSPSSDVLPPYYGYGYPLPSWPTNPPATASSSIPPLGVAPSVSSDLPSVVPSNDVPSGSLSSVLPSLSSATFSGSLPTDAIPTGVIPSGALPSGTIPSVPIEPPLGVTSSLGPSGIAVPTTSFSGGSSTADPSGISPSASSITSTIPEPNGALFPTDPQPAGTTSDGPSTSTSSQTTPSIIDSSTTSAVFPSTTPFNNPLPSGPRTYGYGTFYYPPSSLDTSNINIPSTAVSTSVFSPTLVDPPTIATPFLSQATPQNSSASATSTQPTSSSLSGSSTQDPASPVSSSIQSSTTLPFSVTPSLSESSSTTQPTFTSDIIIPQPSSAPPLPPPPPYYGYAPRPVAPISFTPSLVTSSIPIPSSPSPSTLSTPTFRLTLLPKKYTLLTYMTRIYYSLSPSPPYISPSGLTTFSPSRACTFTIVEPQGFLACTQASTPPVLKYFGDTSTNIQLNGGYTVLGAGKSLQNLKGMDVNGTSTLDATSEWPYGTLLQMRGSGFVGNGEFCLSIFLRVFYFFPPSTRVFCLSLSLPFHMSLLGIKPLKMYR
ncbi:hypothetical protein ACMFMG_002763 [Clarireedia jacksonii]